MNQLNTIAVNQLSEFNYNRLFNYNSIRIDFENNCFLKSELTIDGNRYIAIFELGELDQGNESGLIDDSIRLFENIEGIDFGNIKLTYIATNESYEFFLVAG